MSDSDFQNYYAKIQVPSEELMGIFDSEFIEPLPDLQSIEPLPDLQSIEPLPESQDASLDESNYEEPIYMSPVHYTPEIELPPFKKTRRQIMDVEQLFLNTPIGLRSFSKRVCNAGFSMRPWVFVKGPVISFQYTLNCVHCQQSLRNEDIECTLVRKGKTEKFKLPSMNLVSDQLVFEHVSFIDTKTTVKSCHPVKICIRFQCHDNPSIIHESVSNPFHILYSYSQQNCLIPTDQVESSWQLEPETLILKKNANIQRARDVSDFNVQMTYPSYGFYTGHHDTSILVFLNYVIGQSILISHPEGTIETLSHDPKILKICLPNTALYGKDSVFIRFSARRVNFSSKQFDIEVPVLH